MNKENVNYMSDVFRYLAISILFMFLGFAFGKQFIPESFSYFGNVILIFVLIGLFILALISRKSIIPKKFSMNYVYIFTFFDGILTYPILNFYLQSMGSLIVINILLSAFTLFIILAYIASKQKNNAYNKIFVNLVSVLMIIIVVSIINIFIGSSVISILVSILGIILFSAFTLYDINTLKTEIDQCEITCRDDLSIHVLNLYLDFINIFLDLLNLVWELK